MSTAAAAELAPGIVATSRHPHGALLLGMSLETGVAYRNNH